MTGKITLQQADIERQQDNEIWCSTCGKPAEDGSIYCRYCKTYWEDVESGVFDDPGPFDDEDWGLFED